MGSSENQEIDEEDEEGTEEVEELEAEEVEAATVEEVGGEVAAIVDRETGARWRAVGAGIGLAIVIVTYEPARLGDEERWWAAAAVLLLAVLLADLLAGVRRNLRTPGVAPLPILAALAGTYIAVPETDQFGIAALVPVGLVLMEVIERRQLGPEWYAVAAASVGWAGVFGSAGLQRALVAALFAWWAVAILPLVAKMQPIASAWVAIMVAAIGAVGVAAMERTGGTSSSASKAWLASAAAAVGSLCLALAVVWLINRKGRSQQAEPS